MNTGEVKNVDGKMRLSDAAIVSTFALFLISAGSLIGAILWARFAEPSFRRFYFAYLINFGFFLSLSLGAIFFVLIQHLTQAGWSVGIRRIAEVIACTMPMLAVLSVPILISVLLRNGELYSWSGSHAESGDLEPSHNQWYLNVPFFVVRFLFYFGFWSVLGVWYWKQSTRQDQSKEPGPSSIMHGSAAPATLVFALTLTFAVFDLFMSLDSHWFSTMFGVYYFAGCAVAIFAALILAGVLLQSMGYVQRTLTIEHFHDLGKFLFAFTFFWGYIAFSQFMLIWYANIPEETGWMVRRGTSSAEPNGWTPVALVLLFGHLLIPFGGLLSRHIKRSKPLLAFWAVWLLIMHWIDIYWLIMPEFDGDVHFGVVEILCFVGIGGIFLATALWIASKASLSPIGDPRVHESMVFENI